MLSLDEAPRVETLARENAARLLAARGPLRTKVAAQLAARVCAREAVLRLRAEGALSSDPLDAVDHGARVVLEFLTEEKS